MERSYSYTFEPSAGRVRLIVRGVLDDHTLADAFREIYTDSDYRPGWNELTDCREVARFEMTTVGVRRLLQVVRDLQTAESAYRVAIVVAEDVVFGMARMYELLQKAELEEVQVFRSLEKGEEYTRSPATA